MVRSTNSSFPHSKCHRLTSATSWKFHGNAGNRTRGCWVRSANATSVLCCPQSSFYLGPVGRATRHLCRFTDCVCHGGNIGEGFTISFDDENVDHHLKLVFVFKGKRPLTWISYFLFCMRTKNVGWRKTALKWFCITKSAIFFARSSLRKVVWSDLPIKQKIYHYITIAIESPWNERVVKQT